MVRQCRSIFINLSISDKAQSSLQTVCKFVSVRVERTLRSMFQPTGNLNAGKALYRTYRFFVSESRLKVRSTRTILRALKNVRQSQIFLLGNLCDNCKVHNMKAPTKNLPTLAKSFWVEKHIVFEKPQHYN